MSAHTGEAGRIHTRFVVELSTGWQCLVVAAAVGTAWSIRYALDPLLGTHAPYLPFTLAIMLVAWLTGRRPAFAATALSAIAVMFSFLSPASSWLVRDSADRAGLALFLVVGALISVLIGQLRVAMISSAHAQESLGRQAQLINLSHDAIITADARGIITAWNAGAGEMYGWTETEALGKNIHELLHTGKYARVDELDRALLRDGSWAGELVHTAQDRREVTAECRRVLMRDDHGVPVAMLQTDRDITERKQVEQELAANHRKTVAILESISDGFITFDHEWRYTYVNPAAARMLGKTAAALTGKVIWDVWPDAVESPFGEALRRTLTEQVPVHVEAFYSEPLSRWFEIRCYPSPEGVSQFFSDTTERHYAEERLRQAQKLESIGLLAGGVAHDFNNLLTVIMGSASEALSDCPDCEHSQAILSAAERAAYLTRQLLAYAGKGQTTISVVDLTEIVARARDLLSASVPKRVQLQFELAGDLPYVEADPSQVEQIVMNLVVNAGEAIPPKTDGRIAISTRCEQVTAETARLHSQAADLAAGPYVCLEVRDNGDGMEETTAARIFDPFFTTKFTGRGLGLAAVQGIVRTARGFIQVESSPGAGTAIRVFLPASARQRVVEPARNLPFPQLHGAATILVVDDEAMVRKLARVTLQRYGYEVLEAEDGREALEVLERSSVAPSLALLDLAMPVMGGDELVSILAKKHPGLKIIMSSGFPEDEARKTYPTGAIAGFLQKPYTGFALAEKIAQVINGQ